MALKVQYFVITGEPGVGKTTLVKKLSSLLNESGVKTSGFYTEELRRNGVREGFDVVALDGQRGSLARTANSNNELSKLRVGKYVVDVKEFETVALPRLRPEMRKNVMVIDEIGKMEMFSQHFKNKVVEIFSENSDSIVLATIPIKKGTPLIENIRHNPRSRVWIVTYDNRNTLCEEILRSIKTTSES